MNQRLIKRGSKTLDIESRIMDLFYDTAEKTSGSGQGRKTSVTATTALMFSSIVSTEKKTRKKLLFMVQIPRVSDNNTTLSMLILSVLLTTGLEVFHRFS